MWGLIMLSCVFVLVLGIAAVVDLRDHDRGCIPLGGAEETPPPDPDQRTAERAR